MLFWMGATCVREPMLAQFEDFLSIFLSYSLSFFSQPPHTLLHSLFLIGQYRQSGAVRLTIRLLARIWRIFAFKLVLPRKIHCSVEMRTWPSGALTKAPYSAILGTREVR